MRKMHKTPFKIIVGLFFCAIAFPSIADMDDSEATAEERCMDKFLTDTVPESLARITTEIDLVKHERPEQVDEWNEFIKGRKRENHHGETHLDRPGVLKASIIWNFVYLGPMHKVVRERKGRKLTKYGWETEYVNVEKYSDEEVKEGIDLIRDLSRMLKSRANWMFEQEDL